MENAFIYFISDYFIVLGIFLALLIMIFAKNESPKLGFYVLCFSLLFAVLGYVPFFGGMIKLTGVFESIKEYISLTPFNDYRAMFLNFSLVYTPLNILFKFLITTSAFGSALLSYNFIKRLNQKTANFTLLFLLGTLGANLAVVSNDFLTLLISLEILSTSICFLVGIFNTKKDAPEILNKNIKISQEATPLEAGIKVFLANIFSSALMFFGAGIIYLYTGTLNFFDLNLLAINGKLPSFALLDIGEIIFFIGLLCKICAFPFHFWFVDIFKGANHPTGLFISTAAQIACMGAIIKVLSVLGYINTILNFALVLCSVFTLLIGAFMLYRTADKKGGIKCFLASNCILNAGFVFFGISFLTKSAINAAIFCMIIFAITTFGLYAASMLIIQNIKKNLEFKEINLDTLRGMSYISPFFATMLSFCLLSFAGLPFMAGFSAKVYLFSEVLRVGVRAVYPLVFVILACAIVFLCNIKLIFLIFSKPQYYIAKNGIFKKLSLFNKTNIYTFVLSFCAIMLFLGFLFGGYLMNLIEKII